MNADGDDDNGVNSSSVNISNRTNDDNNKKKIAYSYNF